MRKGCMSKTACGDRQDSRASFREGNLGRQNTVPYIMSCHCYKHEIDTVAWLHGMRPSWSLVWHCIGSDGAMEKACTRGAVFRTENSEHHGQHLVTQVQKHSELQMTLAAEHISCSVKLNIAENLATALNK